MKIVKDGYSLIIGLPVAGVVLGAVAQRWSSPLAIAFYALGLVGCLFMLYFFRDPQRVPDCGDDEFVSAADGVVRSVELMDEPRFLKCPAVRISVFLNPFNVHVNRHVMGGVIREAGYTPGRHLFTIDPRSSEVNEHSSILLEGEHTRCLQRQIVGPIVRRVVYWQEPGQRVEKGSRLGMMKFGSRMDVYFPAADVEATVARGDKVAAGLTVIARLKKREA
ncbi:MAG: phosphatidylserine decarboxylase [Kiritimatiellae bacterium]|jgi:phosphatidylserine decarboxylase|nr:phosphatidylserine decarboxylase [Kiritimatiellia bacterium]MDD4341391.1 phosphatidylserine decarboxylase [Kiritimatiellia bacterium]MDY0148733.1 phosphatidylserine decarboxylase [Kiritimatiellia bacterium]